MAISVKTQLKVADEVWIAAALLTCEAPRKTLDFSIEEIVERAERENLYGKLRPGVYVHVVQHCVANRPPNPGRYRMLFESAAGRRRLYRKGDPYDSGREGAKITPEAADLPEGYSELLRWYEEWSNREGSAAAANDPLLQLAGSGKRLWEEERADEYVRRLRESWE